MSASPKQIRDALAASGIATEQQADKFLGHIYPSDRPSEDGQPIEVWTDGACLENPGGPGGWAAVIVCSTDRVYEVSGGELVSTNNRAEMMAVIHGLRAIPQPSRIVVHSDSRYLVRGASSWVRDWVRSDWTTGEGAPVKNRDLWEALLSVARRHTQVRYVHVRGHSGQPYNERADRLASRQAKRQTPLAVRRP